MMILRTGFTSCVAVILLNGVLSAKDGAAPAPKVASPLDLDDALAAFAVEADLQIELVAAEPQVVDPVAMAFDEHGQLWVVEMRDYPFGPDDGEPGKSRIKLLTDDDGDGRFETAHVFCDGLTFATGVQPYNGGVIVTHGGEISWLADADGDHVADVNHTWFRGFATRNPQLRANDPTHFHDGYVYVACGLHYGGKIETVHQPWKEVNGDKPIKISAQQDFRFDPRTGKAEAIAGGAQFGLELDDLGNRFVCSNSRPLEHVVLENDVVARNPQATISSQTQIVVPGGAATPLFPLSRQETTSYLHEGQFTAACGVLLYGGDAMSDEYRRSVFICEPTASLVHRQILSPDRLTFSAERGSKENQEFLASRDSWFRPVYLSEGPDGALYVVDMYRAVIEHPEWFADLNSRDDLTAGTDRGRIWRITSKSHADAQQRSRNEHDVVAVTEPVVSVVDLVTRLNHPNRWHRMTTSRLFLNQKQAIDFKIVPDRQVDSIPLGRAATLWLLKADGRLTAEDVLSALYDPDENVQAVAASMTEPFISKNKEVIAVLYERIRAVKQSSRLAANLFLSLSNNNRPQSLPSAVYICRAGGLDDDWMRKLVLSSCSEYRPRLMQMMQQGVLTPMQINAESTLQFVQELGEQVGRAGDEKELTETLEAVQRATRRAPRIAAAVGDPNRLKQAALTGIAKGMHAGGKSLAEWMTRQKGDTTTLWKAEFSRAAKIAVDANEKVALRLQAMQLLRFGEFESVAATLHSLASNVDDANIRLAAIHALGQFAHPQSLPPLLADLGERGPGERRAVFRAALANNTNTAALLRAIEHGTIEAAWLDATTRQRLHSLNNKELQTRAAAFLGKGDSVRENVIAQYRTALKQQGQALQGQAIFKQHCANCHRVGEIGNNVGPDIADTYNKTREQLLIHVLDPNRTVESQYEAHTLVTEDGRTLSGMVTGETATAVELTDADGKTSTIPRDQIELLQPAGVSLMPTGLENDVDPDAMADLLEYLKGWRGLR